MPSWWTLPWVSGAFQSTPQLCVEQMSLSLSSLSGSNQVQVVLQEDKAVGNAQLWLWWLGLSSCLCLPHANFSIWRAIEPCVLQQMSQAARW